MFKSLNEKYGKNPVGENAEKYKKERFLTSSKTYLLRLLIGIT